MTLRTSAQTAAADIAAALDSVSAEAIGPRRADEQARWHATYTLSCGHAANDGLREDEHGRMGCPKLNCEGKVVCRCADT